MKTLDLAVDGANAGTVALADNFFLRLRGLLGRSAEDLGGLVIRPCNQVHCCFMKEAIDVVYVDGKGQVLKVDRSMKPWTFGSPVRGAKDVLELPDGRAAQLGISTGTMLSFEG